MAEQPAGKAKPAYYRWNEEYTWKLIGALEEDCNRKVLFGKKDKKENTSGDRKSAVYRRIGSTLFPEELAAYKSSSAEEKAFLSVLQRRVKARSDWCIKSYKDEAKKMLSTGGGLRAQFEGASDENMIDALESAAANSGQPDNLYVGPGGPDETTTPGARNLWEEITANFIYFQRLHALVGSRPNLNPIVIRNGSGETHYPQPRSPDAPPSNMLPPALQWDPSMFTQEDATQAGGFLEMLHATLPAMPGQSPAYSFGSSGASDYSSAVGTPMGTPMLVPISIQAQEGMHAASTQAPSTGRLVPPHVVGTPQQAAPAGPTSTPQETGKKGKKKPAPKAPKPSTMSEEALKQAAAKAAGSAKPKKGMEDTLTSLLKRNAVLQQAKQKSDEEHRNKQLALDLFNAKAISKQQLHDMLGLRKKKRSDSDGDASASFSKRRRVSDVELPSSDNNDSEDETDESLDDDEGESRGSDDDGEDDDVEFEFAVRAS